MTPHQIKFIKELANQNDKGYSIFKAIEELNELGSALAQSQTKSYSTPVVTHYKAILAEVASAKTAIISNVHQREISTYTDNGKQTLLFIGSYKHEPNISAAKTLAQTIFPKVKATDIRTQFSLKGFSLSTKCSNGINF